MSLPLTKQLNVRILKIEAAIKVVIEAVIKAVIEVVIGVVTEEGTEAVIKVIRGTTTITLKLTTQITNSHSSQIGQEGVIMGTEAAIDNIKIKTIKRKIMTVIKTDNSLTTRDITIHQTLIQTCHKLTSLMNLQRTCQVCTTIKIQVLMYFCHVGKVKGQMKVVMMRKIMFLL